VVSRRTWRSAGDYAWHRSIARQARAAAPMVGAHFRASRRLSLPARYNGAPVCALKRACALAQQRVNVSPLSTPAWLPLPFCFSVCRGKDAAGSSCWWRAAYSFRQLSLAPRAFRGQRDCGANAGAAISGYKTTWQRCQPFNICGYGCGHRASFANTARCALARRVLRWRDAARCVQAQRARPSGASGDAQVSRLCEGRDS